MKNSIKGYSKPISCKNFGKSLVRALVCSFVRFVWRVISIELYFIRSSFACKLKQIVVYVKYLLIILTIGSWKTQSTFVPTSIATHPRCHTAKASFSHNLTRSANCVCSIQSSTSTASSLLVVWFHSIPTWLHLLWFSPENHWIKDFTIGRMLAVAATVMMARIAVLLSHMQTHRYCE